MDSTVAAAAIGAAAVLISFVLQQGAQMLKDRHAERRESAAEANRRSKEAAAACDQAFIDIGRNYLHYYQAMHNPHRSESYEKYSSLLQKPYQVIEVHAVDLPTTLAAEATSACGLVQDANQIHTEGLHYHSPPQMVLHITREMHKRLVAFMRNEPEPELSDAMIEYQAAGEDFDDEREYRYAEEIADDEKARNEWLERHPEVKAALDARQAQRSQRNR